eukprot:scaffold110355_cov31-Tisochrysis_lutea.AAC.4
MWHALNPRLQAHISVPSDGEVGWESLAIIVGQEKRLGGVARLFALVELRRRDGRAGIGTGNVAGTLRKDGEDERLMRLER